MSILNCPLLPAQQGMYYESIKSKNSGSEIYIVQVKFELNRTIDITKFWQAWEVQVQRHAILRASIELDNNSLPQWVIHRQVDVPKKYLDISSVDQKKQKNIINKHIDKDSKLPFDYAKAPLMRLCVFKLAHDRYFLLWTVHHVIMEMYRQGALLIEQVFTTYDNLLHNSKRSIEVPQDFIKVMIASCDTIMPNDLIKYWVKIFKNFTTPNLLPIVGAKYSLQIKQSNYKFKLSKQLYIKMKSIAKEQDMTFNTYVLANWGLLLAKYCDNKDIVWGTVRSYPSERVGNVIAPFINTLPIRLVLDADSTVEQVLKKIKQQQCFIRKFINTPLYKISEWCNLSLERPLFNTIVDFKPHVLQEILQERGILNAKEKISFNVKTNYPLALTVVDYKTHLVFELVYNSVLFTKNQIKQLATHFNILFCSLISGMGEKVNNLDMLTSKEQQVDFPCYVPQQYNTIHQIFIEKAKQFANNIAVSFKDKTITYRELHEKSNQIANYLAKKNISKENVIIIYGERDVKIIIAILGVLKVGGCYLLIDPYLPLLQVAKIIKNSQPDMILVTHEKYINIIAALEIDNISVNEIGKILVEEKNNYYLVMHICSGHLAYLVYTSGTSGEPKGTAIEHRSIVNLVEDHIANFGFAPNLRMLQSANVQFDIFTAEWALALLTGGELYIFAQESYFDSNKLLNFLFLKKIHIALLPSAILQSLPYTQLPFLKFLFVGGEACDLKTLNKWVINRKLINSYGLSEAGICSAYKVYDDEVINNNCEIGTPILNTQIIILDNHMNLVPNGVVGKVYIAGVGLAREYFHNQELTHQFFIEHSFSGENKVRLLRTGDLAKKLPNGSLEYNGRDDNQIKIRGYRVEVEEIEKLIMNIPDVKQVAVIVKNIDAVRKILVAFVVAETNKRNLTDDITAILRKNNPDYMVPDIIEIEKMPINNNGKINKKVLISFSDSLLNTEKKIIKTKNCTNKTSQSIIALLDKYTLKKSVNEMDNFFNIGIHSLVIAQLANELSKEFNININVVDIYQNYTINKLSQLIDNRKNQNL